MAVFFGLIALALWGYLIVGIVLERRKRRANKPHAVSHPAPIAAEGTKEISAHRAYGAPLPEPRADEFGYTGRYALHISGEQYPNNSGISRQSLIMQMSLGDQLTLVREPWNSFDKNAVRVDWSGRDIGYISARNAEWVSKLMDEGANLSASVADVFLDYSGGENFLNVRIFLDRVPPKRRPRPVVILLDFLDRVDMERKTWKGQRNWLLRAKEMANSYLSIFWISESERRDINVLLEAIDDLISIGDSSKKLLHIDIDTSGGDDVLKVSWSSKKTKKQAIR